MISKSFILLAIAICAVTSLTVEQAKQNPLQAYVLTDPNGQVDPKSGVRIGPLDLKYVRPAALQRMGLQSELIQKFQPYFNVSGQQAQQLLQQKPLQLTQQEYDNLSNQVVAFMEKNYNKVPPPLRNNARIVQLKQLAEKRDWPVFLQQVQSLLQDFQS
ncbi:unnamed protein product [Brachionus calyciflorus]|uniref:Pesticin C-terminal domain-containing protein n=1 Tax=Brachionus calyciflorus TaxID=104777 RepID=A0A813P9F4_9BILA|nr:unnamed protein product [Brachionus calyciflorus]